MPRVESVLVTRPAGQEQALCEGLRSLGYEPHHQPLIELEPLTDLDAGQRALLLDLDRFRHIIFISGNAVRYGMEHIGDYWPQLPVDIGWYAVGAATAARLGDYGVSALSPSAGEMSSEGLLALPPLAEIADERVLIVKGEGGRDTLRAELLARGARVDELVCYRRCCPALAPGQLGARLREWDIGLILLSSGDALRNMLSLLSPDETLNVQSLTLLLPSRRVADLAATAGFGQLLIADNASDAAVLRALADQGLLEKLRER